MSSRTTPSNEPWLPDEVDCLILGGGITGAGVARDAAIRGHRVLLVDCNDFVSGTSHVTSKVVHGGLRYLDHGHIKAVFENLRERHRLLTRMAPNLVSPLKFVIPFEGRRLAKWLATLCGLQLYGLPEWYRCGRASYPMLGVRMSRDYPLLKKFPFGVTFWDAQTYDVRLVLATLRTAESHGAVIRNYMAVTSTTFEKGHWNVTISADGGQASRTVRADVLINATGPWTPLTAELLGVSSPPLLWLKGSHAVLRRPPRFGMDAIIIASVRDGRHLWAIPWKNSLIIGSTETPYTGDLRHIRPSSAEVSDLLESFGEAFPKCRVTREDILCTYAGVRPIVAQEGASKNSLSREHRIEVDETRNLVTMMGGKLTTFRLMAEQAMDQADRLIDRSPVDSDVRRELRGAQLWPGLTGEQERRLRENLSKVFDATGVSTGMVRHLVSHYGWDASLVLEALARDANLGQPLFPDLPYCLAELAYLARSEGVRHLIDLVKRRTPLYFLTPLGVSPVLERIADHLAPIMGWDAHRTAQEVRAVQDEYAADMKAVNESFGPLPQSKQQPDSPRVQSCAG